MADPTKCRVYGRGLTTGNAGLVGKITVQCADSSGTFLTVGGESLRAEISAYVDPLLPRGSGMENGGSEEGEAGRKTLHVTDEGDGSYRISYFLENPNLYELSIFLDNVHIADSPYLVEVEPSHDQLASAAANESRSQAFLLPKTPIYPPEHHNARDSNDVVAEQEHSSHRLPDGRAMRLTSATDIDAYRFATLRSEFEQTLQRQSDERASRWVSFDHDIESLRRLPVAVDLEDSKRTQQRRDRLLHSLKAVENEVFDTYRALRLKVVRRLPVAFEVEDPYLVKDRQLQQKEKLTQQHKALEARCEELSKREHSVRATSTDLCKQLAASVNKRMELVDETQNSLDEKTKYIDYLCLNIRKKQLRRDAALEFSLRT